jgi:hypothetical protein
MSGQNPHEFPVLGCIMKHAVSTVISGYPMSLDPSIAAVAKASAQLAAHKGQVSPIIGAWAAPGSDLGIERRLRGA